MTAHSVKNALAERFFRIPQTVRNSALGLLLLLTAVIGTVVFGNIVEHIPPLVAFDRFFYELINLGPHPAWLNTLVAPFNFNFLPWGGTLIPSFLYFVFGFGLIYIAIRHRRDFLWACLGVALAIAIDIALYRITNAYVVRDRPFVHLPNNLTDQMKAIWSTWPTYPSGHVRDMALYSTVVAGFAKELRWPFAIFTLWIVFTRLYLGAHYPTDCLAGWALGYFVGVAILLVLKSLQKLYVDWRQKDTGEESKASLTI